MVQRCPDAQVRSPYRSEVLGPLDPHAVASELVDLAGGGVPVMVCYERVGGRGWCHRALVAEWLAAALGQPVPEVGFEALARQDHPMMAAELRWRPISSPPPSG